MSTMKTLNGYEVVDTQARADIEILKTSGGGGSGDLSEYAKKSEIPTKVSQLTNDKKYQTQTEVNTKVNNAINKLEIPTITDGVDWRIVYEDNVERVAYIEDGFLCCSVDSRVEVNAEYDIPFYPNEPLDLSELNSNDNLQIYANFDGNVSFIGDLLYSTIIVDTLDISNYYTKDEVDSKIENVEVDLTGYATEEYVDNAIANIPTGGSGSPVFYIDLDNRSIDLEMALTEELAALVEYYNTNGHAEAYIKYNQTGTLGGKSYIHATVNSLASNEIDISPSIDMHALENNKEQKPVSVKIYTDRSKYKIIKDYTPVTIATKKYVDDAVSNIPGGGSSEGGAKIFVFEHTDKSSFTEEETRVAKEILDYMVANNYKIPDNYVLFFKDNGGNHLPIKCIGHTGSNTLILEFDYKVFIRNIKIRFNSDGTLSYVGAEDIPLIQRWSWVDVNDTYFSIGSYDHIKVLIDCNGEYATYDLCTNSYFDNISQTYVLPSYNDYITLYFSWGSASLNSSNGGCTIIGYYYWG